MQVGGLRWEQVEVTGRRGDPFAVPTIAELITAYRDRTGTPSYEVMARKVRDELQPNRLHQLHTKPPKTFASPRTMELLAELLEVPVATIVLSYAASLGVPVRDAAPELARRLPPGIDALTQHDEDAVLGVVRALVDARRKAEPPDAGDAKPTADVVNLARPPMPDLTRVAARRGESEGRRMASDQDRDAES